MYVIQAGLLRDKRKKLWGTQNDIEHSTAEGSSPVCMLPQGKHLGNHGFHQIPWAQQAQPLPHHAAMKTNLPAMKPALPCCCGVNQRAASGKKQQHPKMSPSATRVGNAGGNLHLQAGPNSMVSVC